MTPRYIVHLSYGYFGAGRGGGKQRPPGVTATVHDTAWLHETVALFRSEDYVGIARLIGGRAGQEARAISDACTLAGKLNWAAP